jgi:RHS repeat-associated protein
LIDKGHNEVLYYLHPEHLGGNLFATDTGGAKSSVQGYYAYDKTRWGNLQTDHRFTGQKYDNTGLYYFNARYYDPVIGTFISPRPAGPRLVPDPTNVWDYNRFAYARLNPLKYNDSSGHTPWDVVDAIFWLMSARDFQQEPTWGNAGWLALDTLTMLPIIPSVGGWVRRGPEAVKITNMARQLVAKHGVDLAVEFTHVAHKPGAMTLLNKLVSSGDETVKGALFELEYARKHTDKIVEIGRSQPNVYEIDFVLEGNVFVNVKDYDWNKKFYQQPFGQQRVIDSFLDEIAGYWEAGASQVKYVFKGSVPETVKKALKEVGVVVEVE